MTKSNATTAITCEPGWKNPLGHRMIAVMSIIAIHYPSATDGTLPRGLQDQVRDHVGMRDKR